MKVASLLHKYKNGDPTVMPAWKALRMATIEAAQALCLGDKVGSLREGKLADLIIIDLSAPQLIPSWRRRCVILYLTWFMRHGGVRLSRS